MGHVRLCKDAQRLKNMQLSKLGELSAMSSVREANFAPERPLAFNIGLDNIELPCSFVAHSAKDATGNVADKGRLQHQAAKASNGRIQVAEQDQTFWVIRFWRRDAIQYEWCCGRADSKPFGHAVFHLHFKLR